MDRVLDKVDRVWDMVEKVDREWDMVGRVWDIEEQRPHGAFAPPGVLCHPLPSCSRLWS